MRLTSTDRRRTLAGTYYRAGICFLSLAACSISGCVLPGHLFVWSDAPSPTGQKRLIRDVDTGVLGTETALAQSDTSTDDRVVDATPEPAPQPEQPRFDRRSLHPNAVRTVGGFIDGPTNRDPAVRPAYPNAGPSNRPAPPRRVSSIDFVDQMIQARQAALTGQFETAKQLFEELIAEYPERHEPYHHLAVMADCRGHYAQAIALYHEAVKRRPNSPQVHIDLANCLIERGRFAEAEPPLGAAIRLAPKESLYRETLALVLAEQGKYSEALVQLTEVMEEADAFYSISEFLADKGNVDGMKECLVLALESNPTHQKSLARLQELAAREKDREEPATELELVVVEKAEKLPAAQGLDPVPLEPKPLPPVEKKQAMAEPNKNSPPTNLLKAFVELSEEPVRYPNSDPLRSAFEDRDPAAVLEPRAMTHPINAFSR